MGSVSSSLGGPPGSKSTPWQAAIVAGLAAAVTVPLAIVAKSHRTECKRLQDEITKYREAADRQTKLRDEERRGRTRAEQRLRKAALQPLAEGSADDACTSGGSVGSMFEPDQEGFVFHPIGSFSSCYRNRCGTPRQGGIVEESLAVLKCARDLNPAAALDSFTDFSHCWVLYVFHENTNLQREGSTFERRQQRGGKQQKGRIPLWQGLCMKVAPPRCPELRVGVLSCRTPHRPNPIGLSLARIVKVDLKAGEVILAGLDVVDGTPCLDLKPYLPLYECKENAKVPHWVKASYDEPLMEVVWSPAASSQIDVLLGVSKPGESTPKPTDGPRIRTYPFESAEDLRRALENTLAIDIRSPVQKSRHKNPGVTAGADVSKMDPFFVGDLWFHELHVFYALLPKQASHPGEANASVRIQSVERRPQSSTSPASKVLSSDIPPIEEEVPAESSNETYTII